MSNNIQGVDLTTGKLLIPIQLASLSGPNNFGETLSLQYSTTNLLQQLKTWNEETQTGEAGLGWSLNQQYIVRVGNGSLDDTFILSGAQTSALILQSKTQDPDSGIYTLVFTTAQQSLNKIVYETKPNDPSSPEQWTIVDTNGITYIYGGNSAAISWGVRWIAPSTGTAGVGQPLVWIGDSTDTANQSNYALAWYLTSKTNIYGQQVNYKHLLTSLNVGASGAGKTYTMAAYLQSIKVSNGDSLTLVYADKETWEYPALRVMTNTDGTITNAYQDRIATQYLQAVSIYNAANTLQGTIQFDYDFLFEHLKLTAGDTLNSMQKRVLTAITYLTPDGLSFAPGRLFDYWGLNDQTQGLNITDSNLLTLVDKDLSGTFTYTDNYQQVHAYTALFGHLKNQTISKGAVIWYSYQEVSANYASVSWPTGSSTWNTLPYAWSDAWKNTLDLTHIHKPTNSSYTWENPFVYWGVDNYAVIRWDSSDKTQITLKVFEWLGCWVEVQIANENMQFVVSNTDAFSVKLITGQGKFILCRLGIKGSSTEGLITLFNRDLYLPGVWHSTYQLNGSSDEFKVVNDKELSTDYQQLEISIGTNIAAVLDKSAQNLYLYSLVNNHWSAYSSAAISFPSTYPGVVIQGDEVVVLAAKSINNVQGDNKYQLNYTLYKFDLTQPADKSWQSSSNLYQDTFENFGELEGINIGFMEGGIFLVQILVNTKSISAAEIYTIYPLVLSWNTDNVDSSSWIVNLQAIYNPQTYNGKNITTWGFGGESKGVVLEPWVASYYGSISASNLINIIPEESADNLLTRYVTRYAGGNMSLTTNQNVGWIGDANFNMLSDNSDPWPQVAIFDNVIENVGSGDSYTYKFYQYTPYGNSVNSGHPYWMVESKVSAAMGSFTDWENINATVSEVLALAGELIKGLTRWIPDVGGEIARVVNKVTRLVERTLRYVAKEAMSGRSGSIVQGMNYLMIGQGGVDKYNKLTGVNGDDAPDPSDYDAYQPSVFAKVWDVPSAAWTWSSLGTTLTSLAQKNANITWSWTSGIGEDVPDKAYDDFILPFLGQEVYGYGNSFIPFSYVMYGGREVDATIAHDSFYRAIYFDQVAFFQNGTICCSQLLPTWQTTPESYKDDGQEIQIYPEKSLPYLLFTGKDTSPPLMYAPWGGILGYMPESMNFYYDPGKHETTDWAWQSNHSGTDADSSSTPPTPQLSLANDLMLALALNNAVVGNVTDYVVNQVAVDDGYQTYNTFFQYMPWYAAGQTDGSINYNQVRTATGSTDYSASALANGWTEYYFYNGGLNYQGSQVGNSSLPYDPASASDSFSKANAALVNAAEYYNLMTGSLYCQRTLISQGSGDFSQGYEVARQQTFYQGFEKYISYDSTDAPTTQQMVTGVLPSVNVSYTAPVDTTHPNIADAYTAGTATLKAAYHFYDLDFTDPSGNKVSLYGPWNPADATVPYSLFLTANVPLRTGLQLGSLIYNYYQTTNSSTANIEAFYTQNLPGLVIAQGNSAYQQFVDLNVYSTVQNITWYHPNVPAVQSMPFANPTVTWGNNNSANWQIINSTVSAWQKFMDEDSKPLCWYPVGQYVWQGNQGSPQATPWNKTSDTGCFQWSNESSNLSDDYWVQQGGSPLQVTENGIVLSILSNTQVPSFTVYDTQQKLAVAQFTNAFSAQENLAFYLGFEAYENVSPWTVVSLVDTSLVYSPISYTGNRSVLVNSNTAATGQLTLSNNFSSLAMDSRNWMFSCSLLFAAVDTNGGTLVLTISANGVAQPLATMDYDLPLQGGWVNYRLPFNFAGCAILKNLTISISMQNRGSSGEQPVFYVDNVYLVPTEAANFSLQTYDSVKRLPIASASQADSNFSTRVLYNNVQQKIGVVQKANQLLLNGSQIQGNQAVSVALTANYFSRNGYNNQNAFAATDPNTQLTVTAGTNQLTAGYYFDFRDGLNPWQGGQVSTEDRYLLLVDDSASYPIPKGCAWGFGIRAQLQAISGTSLPLAAISLLDTAGNSLVAINWNVNTSQYSLTGSLVSTPPASVQVLQAIGDWMLIWIGTTFYFYADGQQIFSQAVNVTDLPQGSFAITAGDAALSCRDIIILQDPSMAMTYSDGAGKTRQTQSLAQVTSPSS